MPFQQLTGALQTCLETCHIGNFVARLGRAILAADMERREQQFVIGCLPNGKIADIEIDEHVFAWTSVAFGCAVAYLRAVRLNGKMATDIIGSAGSA